MKNKFDVVVIGNITRDKIRIPKQRVLTAPGGGVYYSSIPLAGMGLKVAVLTKLALRDAYLLKELKQEGIQIFSSWSDKTTEFENTYMDVKNPDKRICKCLIPSSCFSLKEIPTDIKAKIFHITPLIKGEISLRIIRELSQKGKISLDVQGFTRRFQKKDKQMSIDEWKEKAKILSMVDVLKLDKTEAEILTGQRNLKEALKSLASLGPKELLLTYQKGILIYEKGKFYFAPFTSQAKIAGRTGRGDTAIGIYLGQRLLGKSPQEACSLAAIACLKKMKSRGPFKYKNGLYK